MHTFITPKVEINRQAAGFSSGEKSQRPSVAWLGEKRETAARMEIEKWKSRSDGRGERRK